jgi:hypothetical protein
MRRAVDRLASTCAFAALVVLAASSARATVLGVATHLGAVASAYVNDANGHAFPIVTDQHATSSPGAANLSASAGVTAASTTDEIAAHISVASTFSDSAHGVVTLTEGWSYDTSVNSGGSHFHASGVASGLGYRFVTDQAGDLRVDWSRVASGDPSGLFGLLGPYIILDGFWFRATDDAAGFVLLAVSANTEHEIRFASRSNRAGGLGTFDGEITTTFSFAIPGVGAPLPEPGTGLLVGLGLACFGARAAFVRRAPR